MIRNTGTASAGGYRPPVGRTPSAAAPLGLCLSSLTPTDMRYIYIYIYIYIYTLYIYIWVPLSPFPGIRALRWLLMRFEGSDSGICSVSFVSLVLSDTVSNSASCRIYILTHDDSAARPVSDSEGMQWYSNLWSSSARTLDYSDSKAIVLNAAVIGGLATSERQTLWKNRLGMRLL